MNYEAKIERQTPNYDFLYDKEFYRDNLYRNPFTRKTLSYRILHDCSVIHASLEIDSGIFTRAGEFIKGSCHVRHSEEGIEASYPQSSFSGNDTVIYIGELIRTWGHFLTDSMRLLWFLRSREYAEKFSECPLVYIPHHGFDQAREDCKNQMKLLDILGVKTSMMRPVNDKHEYSTIILPDACLFRSEDMIFHFTQEYIDLADCIRDYAISRAKPSGAEKIYFSYSRYKSDSSIGEDKLEKYFEDKGYKVLYPEEYSLDEQLNFLVNCRSFASTIGSCSHNSIFLRDDTEVILIPRTIRLTFYQLALDYVHRLNVVYIDSSFSIFNSKILYEGPFLYYISENLRIYFHDVDTEPIVSASDFKKYVRVKSGCRFNRNFGIMPSETDETAYKYYSTVATQYLGYIFSHSWPRRIRLALKKIKTGLRRILKR